MNVIFLSLLSEQLLRESPSPWNAFNSRDSSSDATSHAVTIQVKLKHHIFSNFEIRYLSSERANTYFVLELKQMFFYFSNANWWSMRNVFFFFKVDTFTVLQVHLLHELSRSVMFFSSSTSLSPLGNRTRASMVIWNCWAEVIHQQRALMRSHSRWYFNLWALIWSRAFVYSPRFLPVRSSHQRGAFSDTQTSTSTPTHVQQHTCTVRSHYLYPYFVFYLPLLWLQSEIKRISLI